MLFVILIGLLVSALASTVLHSAVGALLGVAAMIPAALIVDWWRWRR